MNEAFLPPKLVLFDIKDTGIYRNAGVSMRVYPDVCSQRAATSSAVHIFPTVDCSLAATAVYSPSFRGAGLLPYRALSPLVA
jgi:hypothetical protein